ncbi:hypothetical protein PSPO01_09485 [Paraphaeosphaeria sporulosa]
MQDGYPVSAPLLHRQSVVSLSPRGPQSAARPWTHQGRHCGFEAARARWRRQALDHARVRGPTGRIYAPRIAGKHLGGEHGPLYRPEQCFDEYVVALLLGSFKPELSPSTCSIVYTAPSSWQWPLGVCREHGCWRLTSVSDERSERGRQPSVNAPPEAVYASTATPALATSHSTPYLRPPLPPSLQRSTSPRSARSASSKGSSSTNLTHPSSNNRVEKKKPSVKPARKQLHCPDCKKDIKNGFDKHFREHLHDLIGSDEFKFDMHEAFGCGYCHAQGVLVEGGKVFHGVAELVQHVKYAHASTPQRLHWDISHSFNHVLSAQPYFRRKIIAMITAENSGNHNNTIPSLSWVADHRPLLRKLQILSGRLDRNPSFHGDIAIDTLLAQVYDAAAQNWQQPFAFSFPPVSPHGAPQGPLRSSGPLHPRQELSEDMSFAGIGKAFPDTPTPQQPPYASDARSPSILSPAPHVPHAPPHVQRALQDLQDVELMDRDAPLYQTGLYGAGVSPVTPTIAFDDYTPYSTPPPLQGLQIDSMRDLYNDLQIDERDLYPS